MRYGVLLASTFGLILLPAAGAQTQPSTETEPESPVLGEPSAFVLEPRPELLRAEAETAIRPRPDPRAPVLTRLDFAADLPVMERDGDWVLVRYGAVKGWVWLVGAEASAAAQTDYRLLAGGLDPEALASARRYLGPGAEEATLGPYALFTDVTDGKLLGYLSVLAERLPEVFRQRFGLEALPGEDEAVVLYARDRAYRTYIENEADDSLLDTAGRAVDGLAVLPAGGRPATQVGSVLVHELTHLLTYRAFRAQLPFWLAEGMADDLSMSRVTPSGELLPGTLASWQAATDLPMSTPGSRTRFVSGPEISLAILRDAWSRPRRPSLAALLQLSRQQFTDLEQRSLHYPMSAFWVRYLLAERAEAFRAFLAAAAGGGPADAEALGATLATGWAELEADWGRWLRGRGPKARPRQTADGGARR